MARFLVVHRLPDVATQEEVIGAGRDMVTTLSKDTEWLRSWLAPEDDHLFCEWEAPDEEAIQTALRRARLFPVQAIHQVTTIDPAWFKV